MTPGRPRVAVVGAGIAGLAAAWEAQLHGADVVVFEASADLGGKLRTSPVDGVDFAVDEGADAFLARVPDALDLCAELEVDTLTHPVQRRAWVFARGALRPLPDAHVLGVPTDVDDVARTGLLSSRGIDELRRLAAESFDPPRVDTSIAAICDERLGSETTTNLVEALVGGINAGEADGLSAAAVAPQIWGLAQRGGSLVDAARAARAAVDVDTPVFAAPAGGMAELVDTLVSRLSADIRTTTPVASVTPDRGGVTVATAQGADRFDAAVVSTPAPVSARLLTSVPEASSALDGLDHSSVVMVTLTYDRGEIEHPMDGSGFVVARDSGLAITACSWGSSKWERWDDGVHALLRVSLGHDTDPVDRCALDDADLISSARADLVTTMGLDAEPIGVRVGRWRNAFAQYRPGHLDLVATLREVVAAEGPLRLASSALGGVGVPACIRQGRDAVRSLLA